MLSNSLPCGVIAMTTAPSVLVQTLKHDIIQDEYQQNDAAVAQVVLVVLLIAGSLQSEEEGTGIKKHKKMRTEEEETGNRKTKENEGKVV